MKFTRILLLLTSIIAVFSCGKTKSLSASGKSVGEQTVMIGLKNKECAFADATSKTFRICVDSFPGDSRCPPNVQCIWEGEAKVRLSYQYGDETGYLDLSTHANRLPSIRNDTLLHGYRLRVADITPHPSVKGLPEKASVVELEITKQ